MSRIWICMQKRSAGSKFDSMIRCPRSLGFVHAAGLKDAHNQIVGRSSAEAEPILNCLSFKDKNCVGINVKSTCSKACDDKDMNATWMQHQPGIRFETVRCSHFDAAFHSASAFQVVRACCLKWASRKAQPSQLRMQSNQLQNYCIN